MDMLSTTFLGFLAGVGGTGLGGFFIYLIRDVRIISMSFILGFSGGIMLVAVYTELIPEALRISGLFYTIIGIILGILFLLISDCIIKKIRPHDNLESYFINSGIVLFLAIACHNFPEGLAIGSGYEASARVGFMLATVLAIHNIPEGMAVATTFKLSGLSPFKTLLATLLAGVPMGLGAWAGQIVGKISPILITVSLGFAAGAMIFTTCEQILPDTLSFDGGSPWGLISGLVIGTILFNIL